MTRYTPEFLAALRQRYEETDQPMRPLALEFGIGISTLSAIVEREGWVKRSLRKRGRPEASLLSEAQALLTSLPARGMVTDSRPTLIAEEPPAPSPPRAARVGGGEKSAAERLEALLLREIAAEEAARAELGELPRLRAEADGCARRLAVMTQTLEKLQALRAAEPVSNGRCQHCDGPDDIDEIRERLARRIEAFVKSRSDEKRRAGSAVSE